MEFNHHFVKFAFNGVVKDAHNHFLQFILNDVNHFIADITFCSLVSAAYLFHESIAVALSFSVQLKSIPYSSSKLHIFEKGIRKMLMS